jgi:hypothetical protein
MIPKKYLFPRKANVKINLYLLSDIHFGSSAFLKDEWERVSDIIKHDPDAYTLFLGDLTDDDRPSTRSMRKHMFSDRVEAFQQEDKQHLDWLDRKIIPQLKPIIRPDRCFGVLDGDHFREYSNGITSVQYVCTMLKIPYLGLGQARINLQFCTKDMVYYSFRIHAQHGLAGTGRPGSGVNKLEDVANQWEGMDAFVRGHNHKGFIYPISKYYEDRHGALKKRDIWLINTPSFRTGLIDGLADYAEMKGYGATATKFPVLKIRTSVTKQNGKNFVLSSSGELI